MADNQKTHHDKLRSLLRDPRYWRNRDADVIAEVKEAWQMVVGCPAFSKSEG